MIRILVCVLVGILLQPIISQGQDWAVSRDKVLTSIKQKNADSALYWYEGYHRNLPKDSIVTDAHIKLLSDLALFLYRGKNYYNKAENIYREASVPIIKKYGPESDEFGLNENFIGQVLYFQRDYTKAEQYYLNSKRIWEKRWTKNSPRYTAACNALGVMYNDKGDYSKAEAQHIEARTIREQLYTKEHGSYAQSCNNLAVTYWNLGQNEKAEPLAIEAKEIRGRVAGITKDAYAISCVNLANIYRDMGKFLQAEPLYIEARKAREEFFTKEHDDYALSCTILADLYYFMRQYDKAEPLYLEAKDIRLRISPEKSYYYSQSCSDLAQLYREMGKYQEAEALALEAGALLQERGDAVEAEIALNNNSLGALYFFMHQYDKANSFLLKARETWKKNLGETHPYYSANSMSLARVSWAQKDITRANSYYLQAFAAQKNQASRMFSFTSENEKQLYLDNIGGNDDEYLSFYHSAFSRGNNGQPYLISLAHRNQVLASSLQLRQLIYDSGDSALTRVYDNWVNLKKQLAALYTRGEDDPREQVKLNDQVKTVEEKAGKIEKELVRRAAVISPSLSGDLSWQDIRKKLKENEAAVEFIEFNYFNGERRTDTTYYAALVLRKGMDEPEMVSLCEKKELDSLLGSSADGVGTINRMYTRGFKLKRDSSLSLRSYEKIWQPLENKLVGVNKIYFAPAGLLHRIAFAALPVDSVSVLSDKYMLVQLSSTSAMLNEVTDIIQPSDKIVLFGGIIYKSDTSAVKPAVYTGNIKQRTGFGYLPGTASEVTGISISGRLKKFKPELIMGKSASEKIVKEMNGLSSPRILHIATHGFFFDDPQFSTDTTSHSKSGGKVFKQSGNPLFRSGLLFAGANDSWQGKYVEGREEDGILTAYEVSHLYLPNTSLVVLSACETALGDIKGSEGVYGLQRSFKMAGVKNLMMSLWKVPDDETAEFMQVFYNNLFNGKPIDHSFDAAQSAMKIKYRREPFKWAAWILVK